MILIHSLPIITTLNALLDFFFFPKDNIYELNAKVHVGTFKLEKSIAVLLFWAHFQHMSTVGERLKPDPVPLTQY
jgi:hypothetical protein